MANKQQILEILSANAEHIRDYLNNELEVIYPDDFELVADEILALGKPEPLAKNKHTQEFCKCKEGPRGRMVTSDFEHQICDRCGRIAK